MLVRVTLIGATGQIDVALPGAVPVVAMVTDLTRLLGMETVEAHLVVTTTGAVLDAHLGLSDQGIGDGAILTLAPVREHVPPVVFDDIVEATHSLSRDQFRSWGSRSAEVSFDAASVWLLGLGAAVLSLVGVLHPQEGLPAGVVAGCGALALLIVAARGVPAGTHRVQEWRPIVAAWFACVYAALAGALAVTAQRLESGPLVTPAGTEFGPVVGSALSAVMAAGVACVVLRRHRLLVVPALVLGAVVIAGTLIESSELMSGQHFAMVVATVWVLASRGAPGAAMEATVLRATSPSRPDASSTTLSAGVDTGQLAEDLAVSHDVVLAVSLSGVGLLLLTAAPALTIGLLGLLWLVTLAGVIALRLRRARLHTHVALGLVGLGVVATSIVLWSPLLPPGLVVVSAGVLLGAGLLVAVTGGSLTSVRAGWLGDRIEVVFTAVCVPLCVAAVWPTLLPGG